MPNCTFGVRKSRPEARSPLGYSRQNISVNASVRSKTISPFTGTIFRLVIIGCGPSGVRRVRSIAASY